MGRFVSCRWEPDLDAPGPRRARRGGSFRAFVPDLLAEHRLTLDARVAADLADAERAMSELDSSVSQDRGPHRLEVLARMLLRAEAVGSSRVEGLVVSPRKLAMADLEPGSEPSGRALEVVGNIHALQEALDLAARPGPFTVARLRAIHARLLADTRDAPLAGVIRTEKNWIGGYTPLDAEYVPPPPEEVPALLEDLCAFVSGDAFSPLTQAAVAHAQFESIHPFADGNGRTGRALVQLVLRRRGLCRRFVPPISLVLATWSKRYVAALMGTRVEGGSESGLVVEGWQVWLELAAEAARVACAQAHEYERRIDELTDSWRDRVRDRFARTRADATVWVLLDWLAAAPLVTARTAAALTGRSSRAVGAAIRQLVAAGVLEQIGGRVRYRLYEAAGVFDLITETERALASPMGDTRRSPPARAVPSRPEK